MPICQLLDEAEKTGQPCPTVETLFRRLAYPFPHVPLSNRFYRFSDSLESLLDGSNWRHSEPAAPVLGLYRLPNLSSVLSGAGLAYLLSRAMYSPGTPLTSVSSSSHRDRPAPDHLTHPPRDSHELRDWLRDLYPELLPPCASHCIRAYDEPSCQCSQDDGEHRPRSPVRFIWWDEADQNINFLEHLSWTSTAAGSPLHAWEYHPLVEATSPWRLLNEVSGRLFLHAVLWRIANRFSEAGRQERFRQRARSTAPRW